MEKYHWIIEVIGWGTIYGFGTESEAENWRVHKARWEKCIARKRKATTEEINANTWKDLSSLIGK